MAGDFDGKVAIVTGGANGIGRQTATRLVAEGASVVIADIETKDGQAAADDLGARAAFTPIRVNCIAPANIATDINAAFDKAAVTRLQPLPHQGRSGDVAEAVLYLASDRAAHVTGTVLTVDGGMSVGTPPRRNVSPTTREEQR